MALIGLGAVTVVAILAGLRASRSLNKALVALFWGGYAALRLGWSL